MNRIASLAVAAALAVPLLTLAPAAHADTYGELWSAVDWLGKKYGVVAYTTVAPLEPGVYADTSGNTIRFNSAYVNDPQMLTDDVRSDEAAGWHPGVQCSPAQYVAAHEFAHVYDNLTGNTARGELAAAIRAGLDGEVSGYAVTSLAEALAESFVAVECDTPSRAEQAIYTMLVT